MAPGHSKPLHPFLRQTLAWDFGARVNASLCPDARFSKRPHKKVTVNGTTTTALLDTGSDISIIREDFLGHLEGSLRPAASPPVPGLWDIQGQPLSYKALYDFTITSECGLEVTFPLYVMPEAGSEVLLGADFLLYTGANVSLRGDTTFDFPKGKAGTVGSIVGSSLPQSVLGARTIADVHFDANEPGFLDLRIDVQDSLQIRPGAEVMLLSDPSQDLNVLDSLLTVGENNTVRVPVSNPSAWPTFIPKGDRLMQTKVYLTDGLRLSQPSQVAAVSGKRYSSSPLTRLTEEKRLYLLAHLDLSGIPTEWHAAYTAFVLDNHDVFSGSKYDIGHSRTISHTIPLRDKEPVYVPQFKIPDAHRDVVDSHVREWLRCKAIRKCRSPYNSPIFCVEKGHGEGLRVVQDLRELNKHTFDDRYCIQDVRSCIDELGRSNSDTFSTLDLSGAFWQLDLSDDGSQEATAFTLPHRNQQFCFTRAPMGQKGSPANFSRLMGIVFEDCDGIITYVDDALCHSKGHEAHLRLLRNVAQRFRQHGLKLNVRKTLLGRKSCDYLGHHISAAGVSPAKDKVAALRAMPEPSSPKKVEEFLGLANYFRNSISNLAKKSFELCLLTRNSSTWHWPDGRMPQKARKAFHEIVDILASEPVMAFPDPKRPFYLSTDACLGDDYNAPGLGAVLCQLDDNGNERPVHYWSRQLKQHERNYSAHAAECRAILDAMDYFHEFVHGRKTVVWCDHRPIEGTAKAHKKTLDRLHELMNTYDLEIRYRPGSENGAADCLSRASVAAITVDFQGEVTRQQAHDPFCSAMMAFLADGKVIPEDTVLRNWVMAMAPHCFISKGALWFNKCRPNAQNRICLIAPSSMVETIVRVNHSTPLAGHFALKRTLERIMIDFHWPTMAKDTAAFIEQCPVCIQCADPSGRGQRVALRPWPQTTGPNQRVHVDLVGPMRTNSAGQELGEVRRKHVLVATCAHTRWVELDIIDNKEAATVAWSVFRTWITRWSCPRLFVFDGGKEFANKILAELLRLMGVSRHIVSPLHPAAQGQVERFNRTMKAYLTALDDTTLNWEPYIPALMLCSNTAYNASTNVSPFYARCLEEPRLPWSVNKPWQPGTHSAVVENMLHTLVETRDLVVKNNEAARDAYTAYYNRKAAQKRFSPGDKILVLYPNPPPNAKVNMKLYRPWRAGYQVISMCEDNETIVKIRSMTDGKVQNVHVNRVKLFHEFDDVASVSPGHESNDAPSSATSTDPPPALNVPVSRPTGDALGANLLEEAVLLSSQVADDPPLPEIRAPATPLYNRNVVHAQTPAEELRVGPNPIPVAPPQPTNQLQSPQRPPRPAPVLDNLVQVAEQVLGRRTTRNNGTPPVHFDPRTHERLPPQ